MTQPRHRDTLLLGGQDGLPYSKGLMARALIATGVSPERAYGLAQRVERDLADRSAGTVELDRLQELAVDVLGENEAEQAVRRLRRYRALQELDVPIILLIGGATGTGKSTVATEVAHRLGITRVTSTDFVRQTMRAVLSHEFMPSIHYSSFDAAPAVVAPDGDGVDPALLGFLDQTGHVLVGVRASLDRALEEGFSMVLEGVHLVPGLLPGSLEGALLVNCMLAIEDEAIHESHFWVRDAASDGLRAVDKYVRALPRIRLIQDYLVERARKAGVPVVENRNIELAIATVMELVFAGAERLERGRRG